mmetsp:Transcript_99708/g.321474  ORF Transcript_99708/g.321474 Transcript_99708/m.321474 type:complete len:432 (+) Transcript_99708:2-1297(+)
MDAFEVCDARSGLPLSEDSANRLQKILERVVRAPAARQVLAELDGQVPKLQAFFGLPEDGSQPPPLEEVEEALAGGSFQVSDASDLGRAFVLRGNLQEGATAEEALVQCQQLVDRVPNDGKDKWECIFAKGYSDVQLVVLPSKDLKDHFRPYFDEWVVFLISIFLTVIYVQGPGPSPSSLAPSPTVCALVFGVTGIAEFARRFVAAACGARLSLPFVLPSPTLGTLGAVTRSNFLVPSARVAFDMAVAALSTAFLLSLFLIGVGLTSSPAEYSCTWVNPRVLPSMLGHVVELQAEPWSGFCPGPSPGTGYLPASSALVAGVLGLVTTALNALPLRGLDGAQMAEGTPWVFARRTLLPAIAVLTLLATTLDINGQSLFPLVLVFLFVSFVVRPQLAPAPVFRDNLTQPLDLQRRGLSFLLIITALLVLLPSS